jgi:flagellar biosynthesis protein FlhF
MKLRRFVEPDMRQALARIKQELGPDAVIMSNRRLKDGIEIVAGIEDAPSEAAKAGTLESYLKDDVADDEVTIGPRGRAAAAGKAPAAKAPARRAPAAKAAAPAESGKAESFARSLIEILERQKNAKVSPPGKPAASEPKPAPAPKAAAPKPRAAKRPAPAPISERSELAALIRSTEQEREEKKREADKSHGISSYDSKEAPQGDLASLRDDVESIKKLLRYELAGLMRERGEREQPVRSMLREVLSASGFDPQLASELVSGISPDASVNFAWRELCGIIEKRLITGSDEVVSDGGVVALIGPAGVGKTTTLAKLAARFVISYGPEKVAMVTADHYRIGAVEQVRTYGRIMGCDAMAVNSLSELPQALVKLRDKSLVLIDTAGVGLNDKRFETQLSELKAQKRLKLKHYLVLPAEAQRRTLEGAYDHFKELGIDGLVLTKTDESANLCDALSLCLKHKLKLCYVTNGQRVPEDIRVPGAAEFTRQALSAIESDAAGQALGAPWEED